VREDVDAYVVHVEVPGVPRENMDIAMHDGALVIRGRKESTSQNGDARFRRVERSYGSFARALQLPRNVDPEQISASLNDGVLEVRLPKREEIKPRRIAIGDTREAQTAVPTETEAQSEVASAKREPLITRIAAPKYL